MEQNFDYISTQFRKCERDAHSVLQWLTGPASKGGKEIPEPIALEVMLDFAKIIAGGHIFGFNDAGLSILSLSVFEECHRRRQKGDAEVATKILQTIYGQAITADEFDSFANDMMEFVNAIYEGMLEEKTKKKSFWKRITGKK
jgi:hypothetical protein